MKANENIRIRKVRVKTALIAIVLAYSAGILTHRNRDSIWNYLKHEVESEIARVWKAPMMLESVGAEFDVRTPHVAQAETLDYYFQGTLAGTGSVFVSAGEENGISPFFLAAIAMHESGNGSSRMARDLNNPMGILVGGKHPRKFESTEGAVRYMANRLNSNLYIKSGHCTVAEIQKIYCPINAKNDPKGLNKYWLNGVITWMNRFAKYEIEGAESGSKLAVR